jgi:putative CocE/NonD family hydrolase
MRKVTIALYCLFIVFGTVAQQTSYVKDNYTKLDTTITMRDGAKLYTVIYTPKDQSQQYPILMMRTPYSSFPYGDVYPRSILPNDSLMREKYIFVKQDVRGRHMSEGVNEEVTPFNANKKGSKDVDESSDTYDTIDWLLKFLTNDNGRVGLYGISYPGFYASAALPGAHPAIKAVSPQAPVTDEFIGDDANHNGAFFLLDNFDFMEGFDAPRPKPVQRYTESYFDTSFVDAYRFFLDMKTIKASNGPLYFNHKGKLWNEYLQNDTYNDYWKSRNIRQHLKNISIPVLTVGGWFDAEDLFGALHTYESIEKQSPGNKNFIVMGPWTHGAWAAPTWTKFGTHDFTVNVNKFYHDSIETAFFNYYLKDKGTFAMNEATMFMTGTNTWKSFDQWPPRNASPRTYYFGQKEKLYNTKQSGAISFTEYTSDPNKPVPYTNGTFAGRNNEYMIEDQRFAAERPDVIYFQSDTLTEDLVLAGPITADLFVSTTGTDADFIVKLIDVLPTYNITPRVEGAAAPARGTSMLGMQRLVRAEVMRGKFRNDFSKPVPFVPGKVAEVKFGLNDVLHSFAKGHRIMIQVQSSWFPLVDRNPQKFMRIPDANESDYQKATIRVYHDNAHPSNVTLMILQ